MRRPVLILKTGETLPEIARRLGDFEDWIADGLGPDVQVTVCRVDREEAPPDPAALSGVVVTGSSAMVSSREPWSESAASWLLGAVEAGTPVLGICYGHQLLAHALGGEVGPNPRGREIGTVTVRLTEAAADDPLLGGFTAPLQMQATHLEAVRRLPPGAVLLGSTEGDPHQAFRAGRGRAWGVQFHPEFSAEVTRGYLRARRERMVAEGLEPDDLMAAVRETPDGRRLLLRFAALVDKLRES